MLICSKTIQVFQASLKYRALPYGGALRDGSMQKTPFIFRDVALLDAPKSIHLKSFQYFPIVFSNNTSTQSTFICHYSITIMSNFTTATSTSVTSVTAFLALTTPFVEPPACKHGYVVITDTQSAYNNVFLVSDPASPDYTSCQPQEYRPENSHSYSAAVCPESWNAINMATHLVVTSKTSDSRTIPSTRTISSAHCCMRYRVPISSCKILAESCG